MWGWGLTESRVELTSEGRDREREGENSVVKRRKEGERKTER